MDHSQKIMNDHKKLKLQIEMQMNQSEEQREELKKREASNESEMKRLLEEVELVFFLPLLVVHCLQFCLINQLLGTILNLKSTSLSKK